MFIGRQTAATATVIAFPLVSLASFGKFYRAGTKVVLVKVVS